MRYYIQRHSHRIVKLVLFVALLLIIGLATRFFITNRGELGKLDDKQSPTTEGDASPVKISSRILAVGNTSWGGHLYDLSQANALKEAYPFSGLNSLSRPQYDAWVGNLTCSIDVVSSPDVCPSGYLSEVKKWFSVFALGNSRTDRGGALSNTTDSLKKSGIQYVGSEDSSSVTDLCEVVSLPARFELGDGSFKAATFPLAICSINASSGIVETSEYDVISRYSRVLPTWVYIYMGDTNVIAQSELQRGVFRSFIDEGADLVIGNHPYAVQGAESYKGKLILYSLGNFMYQGSDSDPELHKSVSLSATVSSKIDKNMDAWANLSNNCRDAHDSCLTKAKDLGLAKPVYSYDLSIVMADNIKDSIVMKSTGSPWEEQASKRVGWEAILPTLTYAK